VLPNGGLMKRSSGSYLARTLSNMARASLDIAVSRVSDDREPPPGEKWEMR
jgi:hypothetical protein